MTFQRFWVEKLDKAEANQLLHDLQEQLGLSSLLTLAKLDIYDITSVTVENIHKIGQWFSTHGYKLAQELNEFSIDSNVFLAKEPIPGLYNPTAETIRDMWNLDNININDIAINTGTALLFNGQSLSAADLIAIKHYWISPVEEREKDIARARLHAQLPTAQWEYLSHYAKNYSTGLTDTALEILAVYWSDHCRHTTFNTNLTNITFAAGTYQQLLKESYQLYLDRRSVVYGTDCKHDISLMDLAIINTKYLRRQGCLSQLDSSDEVNACAITVELEIIDSPATVEQAASSHTELFSIQFKNETHNHPTEIAPYSGAATCLGGAIRDPLSGRSYAYQAVRISGAADPTIAIADTLVGKLPQRTICSQAAAGFASYGNQIGIATTLVHELYHPGYLAKRLEVGLVLAAAPACNIARQQPTAGDRIILLGGRTGRDGCGGATSSSATLKQSSISDCATEVQTGNPIIERKLQRLLRNPAASKLIKKANDLGAGGIAVAVTELANIIVVNLDHVLLKDTKLSITEICISESQERLAVVVAQQEVEQFIQLAAAENLEAVDIGMVLEDQPKDSVSHGMVLFNHSSNSTTAICRAFLDNLPQQQQTTVNVATATVGSVSIDYSRPSVLVQSLVDTTITTTAELNISSKLRRLLGSLQLCSQQGLSEIFDATIGSTTVLLPFGGKYRLSPTQVSAQKIATLSGDATLATIIAFGFDPALSSASPFHGAYYASLHAIAKVVAAGGRYQDSYFSLQEYFEKLGTDPTKWGKVLAALLGAFTLQTQLGLAAIGGKDSMSGTYQDKDNNKELNVPPTIIAFAVTPTLAKHIISPELKSTNSYIYAYIPTYTATDIINSNELCNSYTTINKLIIANIISSAWAIDVGGIAEALAKMSFGNKVGLTITPAVVNTIDLFKPYYGSIVFEITAELVTKCVADLECFSLIATTNATTNLTIATESLALDDLIACWQQPLSAVYPLLNITTVAHNHGFNAVATTTKIHKNTTVPRNIHSSGANHVPRTMRITKPQVFIPIFPGTNCEYDTEKAFTTAGATVKSMVFNDLSINLLPNYQIDAQPHSRTPFEIKTTNIERSLHAFAAMINDSQILALAGGFSAADKPSGMAGAFIATVLRHAIIDCAIKQLLARGGLIIGICNGFQALIKAGYFGNQVQISLNKQLRHLSALVPIRICNTSSPWLRSFEIGEEQLIPISHGEGCIKFSSTTTSEAISDLESINLACQYIYNPNGSYQAIEALCSADGRILGRMGHAERCVGSNLYKNIPGDYARCSDIFANGVRNCG